MAERLTQNLTGAGMLIPEGYGPEAGIVVQYHVREFETFESEVSEEFRVSRRIEASILNPKDTYFAQRSLGRYFTLHLESGLKLDCFIKRSNGALGIVRGELYR